MIHRDAQVIGNMSPRQLHVVWRHLILAGPQHETCFMSSCYCLHYWGGSLSFGQLVSPHQTGKTNWLLKSTIHYIFSTNNLDNTVMQVPMILNTIKLPSTYCWICFLIPPSVLSLVSSTQVLCHQHMLSLPSSTFHNSQASDQSSQMYVWICQA